MRSRSAQGSIAKKNGQSFERRLESYFILQNNLGFCDIRKQNEALKPVRSLGGGKFLAVYQTQSGCDYFGTLYGGNSIVAEAKHRESDRIRLSDFTESEINHLKKTSALGGYALVFIEFSDKKMFLIPFALIEKSELLFRYKHIKEVALIDNGFEFSFSEKITAVAPRNFRKGMSMILSKKEALHGIEQD